MKEKQLLTSERLLTAILSLTTVIAGLVTYIYIDNKKANEANYARLELMINKIDGKVVEHCEKATQKISEIESDIDFIELELYQKPKKRRTFKTLTNE